MQNEIFAREFYARWDSFFAANVERIADEILEKYDNPAEILEISRFELDLGTIPENEFDGQFAIRFRQQLEDALLRCFHNPPPGQKTKVTFVPLLAFDLLKQFLLNGFLPWHAVAEYRDIRHLFLTVLKENARQFKQFLQTYGHYTSLQERLVYQLEDPELEKGVHLLESANATFICSYIKLLRAKYETIKQPAIRESDYRHTIWFVVYAYLLNNRSSFFDKKAFVAQTLVQLSAKYNLNYNDLLELITQELQAFADKLSMPPELFTILLQLQKELNNKQLKSIYTDSVRFYKTISALLKKKIAQPVLPENSREALIRILSQVDSCRLFLQQMKEPEIIHLVEMVAPAESHIVIETAKTLDRQKEQGALQGRAGGEFRLLKWQIIFPVLFENRGAGFNRIHFVRRVLWQIAAHYNLEVLLLLEYFMKEGSTPLLDKDLLQILLSLREQLMPSLPEQPLLPQTKRSKNRQFVKQPQGKTIQAGHDVFNPVFIFRLSEEEKYTLIRQYFPAESEFIVDYVQSLDKLNEHTHRLQGKAGGEFREVKWRFVFTVLDESNENGFNRRYFVNRVLAGIAAHYNLTAFDLLLYFRQTALHRHLPFRLYVVLQELYREEQQHWTAMTLRNGSEADRLKLTAALAFTNREFVKTYTRALDAYYAKGVLQGKVSGDFRQIKWKFIINILIEMQYKVFNKEHFVAGSLQQMAAHYNLSFGELLSYFASETAILKNEGFAEVSRIIRKLFAKEKAKRFPAIEDRQLAAIIEKLPPVFAQYIRAILRDLSLWCKQYAEKYGEKPDYKQLESLLLELSKRYQSMSLNEISQQIKRVVADDSPQVPDNFEEVASFTPLLPLYVNNAGVVLLSPFLSRLFSLLELTEGGQFKDREAQIRAVFLIQYIVFGTNDSEYPEQELVLNKLLTGLQIDEPLPRSLELTEKETEAVSAMMQGVLQNWDKMKNTSISGLREGFLQREGRLDERADIYSLMVEEKTYDMLLDSLPWSFKMTKYQWMEKMLFVRWR